MRFSYTKRVPRKYKGQILNNNISILIPETKPPRLYFKSLNVETETKSQKADSFFKTETQIKLCFVSIEYFTFIESLNGISFAYILQMCAMSTNSSLLKPGTSGSIDGFKWMIYASFCSSVYNIILCLYKYDVMFGKYWHNLHADNIELAKVSLCWLHKWNAGFALLVGLA